MLIDVTHRDTLVRPRDAESYQLLQAAKKQLGNIRFTKDCSIVDTELDRLVEQGQARNKLVFAKAGIIAGHSSCAPHKDYQHIWDSAEMAFPSKMTLNRTDDVAAETQLKFIGGLVRWRISLRDETWLVYRQPSGKYNTRTGKEITVSEYWIKEDFVFERPSTAQDLVNKFKKK